MKSFKRWRTKSGVLVEERGRFGNKIAAYRVPSGGYHGLLHIKNLKPSKARTPCLGDSR